MQFTRFLLGSEHSRHLSLQILGQKEHTLFHTVDLVHHKVYEGVYVVVVRDLYLIQQVLL